MFDYHREEVVNRWIDLQMSINIARVHEKLKIVLNKNVNYIGKIIIIII